MLDCDPSDIDDPSEDDRGGVSEPDVPEFEVHMLDLDHDKGPGLGIWSHRL